jgi:hypothetical protein
MKLVDFEPIADNSTSKSIKIKPYVLDDEKMKSFDKFLRKQPLGKFISNSSDYRPNLNRDSYFCMTLEEEKEKAKWIEHFDIGEPVATEFYTKEQLIEQGMIGLYQKVV